MEVHKCRPWPIRGPRKIITRQSINIFNSSSILMTNSAAADHFLPTTRTYSLVVHYYPQRAMSQSSITPASQPGLGTLTRDGLWIVSCCRFLSIKQMFNKYGGVRSWRKNQSPSDVRLPIDRSKQPSIADILCHFVKRHQARLLWFISPQLNASLYIFHVHAPSPASFTRRVLLLCWAFCMEPTFSHGQGRFLCRRWEEEAHWARYYYIGGCDELKSFYRVGGRRERAVEESQNGRTHNEEDTWWCGVNANS